MVFFTLFQADAIDDLITCFLFDLIEQKALTRDSLGLAIEKRDDRAERFHQGGSKITRKLLQVGEFGFGSSSLAIDGI